MGRDHFDAVLCDIDGVVRLWGDGMQWIDEAHGFSPGTLAAVAFDPVRLEPAITGAITDDQWRQATESELAARCGSRKRARDAVSAWSELIGSVNHDVLDLLTEMRTTTPVVLVSNATSRLETDLAHLGLLDAVDAVVSSAHVGVAKPDPQIYRVAARRVDAEMNRCLFIDDTPRHVEAARELGMTAIHFTGVESLRGAIVPASRAQTEAR